MRKFVVLHNDFTLYHLLLFLCFHSMELTGRRLPMKTSNIFTSLNIAILGYILCVDSLFLSISLIFIILQSKIFRFYVPCLSFAL